MAKKRVLIITYYWPPSGGAGVQRWLKFVKYLPEFGWEPVVVVPRNPEYPSIDQSLEKEIPKNTEIIKLPIWEPYSWYKRFTGKRQHDKINAGFISEKKQQGFLEKFSIWIRGNLFIPDPRKFWIKPTVRFLINYIKHKPIDIVITTGPPHSVHFIGIKLKEHTRMKWLADFRDPWTNIDFYKDLRLTKRSDKLHRRLEKEVLQKADIVIAVSNTLASELRQLGAANVRVVTNGYDHDDLPTEVPMPTDKFTIIHMGSLNKDRNHESFWEALKILIERNPEFAKTLELRFIGKTDYSVEEYAKKFGLIKHLHIENYIPHNQVMIELMRSHLLYLPINRTPNAKGILTGKFFEYLAANRPILAIGPIDGDVAEILANSQCGKIFDFNDNIGIAGYISSAKNTVLFNRESTHSYSRVNLTKTLIKQLNSLLTE